MRSETEGAETLQREKAAHERKGRPVGQELKEALARRQEAEREERRTRILDAGRRVFLKKGYLGTSIRAIAVEAELSPGLIYFYFAGKDEIYGRICEEAFHLVLDMLEKASATQGTFAERLNALAWAYVDFYRDYPEYFDIISFKDLGFKKVGLTEEHHGLLEELSQKTISYLKAVVDDALATGEIPVAADSWTMTFALWGVIEGALYIHKRGYLDSEGVSLEVLLTEQLRILRHGLGIG
jgi:AcrR family transcriptional regulator